MALVPVEAAGRHPLLTLKSAFLEYPKLEYAGLTIIK
jgi:hypothetical protein